MDKQDVVRFRSVVMRDRNIYVKLHNNNSDSDNNIAVYLCC